MADGKPLSKEEMRAEKAQEHVRLAWKAPELGGSYERLEDGSVELVEMTEPAEPAAPAEE